MVVARAETQARRSGAFARREASLEEILDGLSDDERELVRAELDAEDAYDPERARRLLADILADAGMVDPETRALGAELATDLGLEPDAFSVHLDAARTSAVGRLGLMEDGAVYLDPLRFDAATRDGRALLAHELVHVAQRENEGGDDLEGAEHEAEVIALDFAAGRPIAEPVQSLAPDQAAACGPKAMRDRGAIFAVIEGERHALLDVPADAFDARFAGETTAKLARTLAAYPEISHLQIAGTDRRAEDCVRELQRRVGRRVKLEHVGERTPRTELRIVAVHGRPAARSWKPARR